MAGIHTYKHNGQDVSIYGIDHSVGAGGVNRMDDVQLIQVLINRYIDWREYAHKTEGSFDSRVVDKSGQQIGYLKVDGRCGTLTMAAIIATQKSLNKWRGTAIDGRFDAFKDGSGSAYKGPLKYGHLPFAAMYILAQATNVSPENSVAGAYASPGTTRFDVFSLPDPLRSSLLRANLKALASQMTAALR